MTSTRLGEPRPTSTRAQPTRRAAGEGVEHAEPTPPLGPALFRRYFDLGLIGMALTSPTKGILEVNDALCRLLGYPRGELLSKRWPELTHPDDLATDIAHFDRVTAGELEGYQLDKRFVRGDGRAIWATMAANCLRAPDGSVDCFVGLMLDISGRVEAVDAAHRTRDQLAHAARAAAMGELVAAIAHEVNQPLAAISANGDAAIHWLSARPPNLREARSAIRRMIAQAHRASHVVDRVRALVRRNAPQRAPVAVHEMLQDVIGSVASDARVHGVAVDLDAEPPGLAPALGDRYELQQAVLNLVLNGIEATAPLPAPRRRVQLRVESWSTSALRVSVRDWGTGIPLQERERVFEPFYSSKPGAMGMGLAISRTIVEAHQGRLWCTPNETGGETFSFTLPM
jgi:PAS domain S-box-containing protein